MQLDGKEGEEGNCEASDTLDHQIMFDTAHWREKDKLYLSGPSVNFNLLSNELAQLLCTSPEKLK